MSTGGTIKDTARLDRALNDIIVRTSVTLGDPKIGDNVKFTVSSGTLANYSGDTASAFSRLAGDAAMLVDRAAAVVRLA